MNWWQIYIVIGLVLTVARISTRSFREGAQCETIPNSERQGHSRRAMFFHATIACAIVVLIWPKLVWIWVREIFE